MIRHPQWAQVGARAWMAHSKLSKICDSPPIRTSKHLSYVLPHTSQVAISLPNLFSSLFITCLFLSLFTSCCLRLLDVLAPGPLLGGCRLGALRHILARLRLEAVAADVHRPGAQLPDQVLRILAVTDQFAILHVGVLLADQPLDRRPGAARTLPGYPLQVTRVPNILCTEGLEIISFAYLDVVVFSLPAAARLFPAAAIGFCGFSIWTFSTGCHLSLLYFIRTFNKQNKPLCNV